MQKYSKIENSRNPQKTMHAKKLTHAMIMHAPILMQQSFFTHLSHVSLHKEKLVGRDLLTFFPPRSKPQPALTQLFSNSNWRGSST
jgi:hypothetical protein